MPKSQNRWQHRKGSLQERFGLLDPPNMRKYDRHPVFQPPQTVREPGKELTALGITCGIGSMLVGAQDLGFRVLGNIEWRDYYRYVTKNSKSTFTHNFPNAFMSRGMNDIPSHFLPGQVDFAAGHPECGRYSTLSFSVTKGSYQDTRGDDVSDIPLFLEMVGVLQPRFFLMDDLPQSFGPLPMDAYVEALPDYDLFPEWISNWGYGNIQKHRNRMFVVGARKQEKFVFSPGEREHNWNLRDVIGDLVETGNIPNHATVDLDYHPGRYVNMSYYGHRPSWKDMRNWNGSFTTNVPYVTPEGEQKIRPGTRSPEWDGWCPVLSGGFNPIHPIRRLPLSIRERARIQGFEDDFIFFHDDQGPDRNIWEPYCSDGQRGIKQTGKAMPVQFCTFVAEQVMFHIQGHPYKTTGKRLLKPNDMVSQAKFRFCEISGYADQEKACSSCWLRSSCSLYKGRVASPRRESNATI